MLSPAVGLLHWVWLQMLLPGYWYSWKACMERNKFIKSKRNHYFGLTLCVWNRVVLYSKEREYMRGNLIAIHIKKIEIWNHILDSGQKFRGWTTTGYMWTTININRIYPYFHDLDYCWLPTKCHSARVVPRVSCVASVQTR